MKILDVPQSGSLAGQTSSRNTYGQYRRSRSSPAQPNTSAQVAARALLSNYAALWRTLSDNERSSWDAYAAGLTRYDSLGQAYKLSGFQSYVGAQTLRDRMNETQKVTIPVGPSPSEPPGSLTLALTSGTTVTVTGAVVAGADARYEIWAGAPQSAGRKFNGDYRFMATATGTELSAGKAIVSQFSAKFGAPVEGTRVFIRVRCVYDGVVWWTLEANGKVGPQS